MEEEEDGADVLVPSSLRYAFDRSIYLRMLRDISEEIDAEAESSSEEEEPASASLMGHCVVPGEGEPVGFASAADSLVRIGTVGVGLSLADIRFVSSDSISSDFGDEVGIVAAVGSFRFELVEVVSTFPYPIGKVRKLRDDPVPPEHAEAAEEAEGRVKALLSRLVEISGLLESMGQGNAQAEAAAAKLEVPAKLLAGHERAVEAGNYADLGEQIEAFSLGACSIVLLPHADASEALSTRSGRRRLELLADHLEPIVEEMASLSALDGFGGGDGFGPVGINPDSASAIEAAKRRAAAASAPGGTTGAAAGAVARESLLGGTTSFSPIDIPLGTDAPGAGDAAAQGAPAPIDETELPEGARIEFWYNEDYGWIAATVKGRVRDALGALQHTLFFDVDGTTEDCPLTFGDGKRRWRALRE